MKSKLLLADGQKTWAVVLDTGDEVMQCLETFAVENSLSASQITAIGAFERLVLGFFDLETKDYERIPVDEQVEVVSMVGDVAQKDGKPKLHIHVVVSRRDGTALGGHLLEAHVRPTLEVLVQEAPAHLKRATDEATGLPLIDIGDGM